MTISSRSFGTIWDVVWGQRGGGPLHFLLEHLTLQWPGGLVGLRAPSILFVVLALPAVALLARELVGPTAAAVTVVLLAPSPLVTSYSSFGRPHVLLLMWIAWGAWLTLHAAAEGGRWRWVVAAVALASSLLVHPTAPLYALTVLGCGLLYADRSPRALLREAWPGLVVFAALFLPYYVHSLHVLRARYGVGEGRRGRTYSGNSVFHDAVTTLSPSTQHPLNLFTVLALVGVAALLVRRRWRNAAVCALVVAAPIVFFTFVPSQGRSAIFFTRYMLPALPFFLALVAAGCVWGTSRLGAARVPVLVVLVGALCAWEVSGDLDRLGKVRGIQLGHVVESVRAEREGAILFGSTGTIGRFGDISTLSYGRPPVLLDRYVLLRVDGLRRVDDDSCIVTRPFLRERAAAKGIWLFYAPRPEELAAGRRALPGARTAGKDTLLVTARGTPRALLERGLALRRAWSKAVPRDFKARYLIRADEIALRGTRCVALGEYGNPDITPAADIRPTPRDGGTFRHFVR